MSRYSFGKLWVCKKLSYWQHIIINLIFLDGNFVVVLVLHHGMITFGALCDQRKPDAFCEGCDSVKQEKKLFLLVFDLMSCISPQKLKEKVWVSSTLSCRSHIPGLLHVHSDFKDLQSYACIHHSWILFLYSWKQRNGW